MSDELVRESLLHQLGWLEKREEKSLQTVRTLVFQTSTTSNVHLDMTLSWLDVRSEALSYQIDPLCCTTQLLDSWCPAIIDVFYPAYVRASTMRDRGQRVFPRPLLTSLLLFASELIRIQQQHCIECTRYLAHISHIHTRRTICLQSCLSSHLTKDPKAMFSCFSTVNAVLI